MRQDRLRTPRQESPNRGIEKETEIKNLCLQYIKAPTRTLAANLARRISALGITILGEESSRCAADLARRLSLEESLNAESSVLLAAVRRLRHLPESFADDGRNARLMLWSIWRTYSKKTNALCSTGKPVERSGRRSAIPERSGGNQEDAPHPLHCTARVPRGEAERRNHRAGNTALRKIRGLAFPPGMQSPPRWLSFWPNLRAIRIG